MAEKNKDDVALISLKEVRGRLRDEGDERESARFHPL
jgi:hypothetical protein